MKQIRKRKKKYKPSPPGYKDGQIAPAVANENLWNYILEGMEIAKDKSGLYDIRRTTVECAIIKNTNLHKLFGRYFNSFNEEINNLPNYCVPENVIRKLITSLNDRIVFDNESMNFLVHLMICFSVDIARLCGSFMKYSGKKSIDRRSVQLALEFLCNKTLAQNINVKIDNAKSLLEENEDGSETEEKSNEKVKPKESSKTKESSEKTKTKENTKGKTKSSPTEDSKNSKQKDDSGNGSGGDSPDEEAPKRSNKRQASTSK